MVDDTHILIIPILYMVCFFGLAWSFGVAVKSGMDNYANVYSETTARGFSDIFFFIPRKRILELAWTGAVTSFVIFFLLTGGFDSVAEAARGFIFGLIAGGAALAAPGVILKHLKNKRIRMFNEQLVDALMTMSNALKSGSSILQSFEHIVRENVNPISQELGMFLQQTRIGVKIEDALDNLEKRVDSEDLTLVISSIQTARQTGGNLTEVFEQIAATIRERMRIQAKIRTFTSQGRLQGVVVGLMPVALGAAMFYIDPAMMIVFFRSPIGMVIIGLAVFFEICGVLLIRKIINIDI